METLIALIPTRPSALYDSFGVDVVAPTQYGPDGEVTRDMEPIEWIEVGPFPAEEEGWGQIRERLQNQAVTHGFSINWSTQTWRCAEFIEVEVSRLG